VATGRDPQTGRYGQLSRVVRGSKRTAQEAAAALLTEVRQHGAVSTKGTVAHLLEAHLEHARARGLAPKTILGYEGLAKQVCAELGNVQLRKLTAARLDQYYGTLAKRGLSSTTVHHHHAYLRGALRQAVRWGWITRSPADSATPPSPETPEPTAPSVDAVRKLFDIAGRDHPDLASLLWVAATTGMRRGELCGLRWSDVDLVGGTLTVRRSISDMPGGIEVRQTKTRRVRRIAIDATTGAVLEGQLDVALKRCAATGTTLPDDAYVWSEAPDHSAPWRPDHASYAFERVRAAAGLREVRFHHLRHFAATMMLASGVDVRTAAGRLGHAEPSVTLRVYAHALQQRDREAAALLGGLLSARE
jgi:integrase